MALIFYLCIKKYLIHVVHTGYIEISYNLLSLEIMFMKQSIY